jgi:hypothetical protein
MVISYISGGLGNQMFQYAAGLSLARLRKTSLFVDVRFYSENMVHQGYELDRIFECDPLVVNDEDLGRMIGERRHFHCQRILKLKLAKALRGRHFVVEPDIRFWPDFFSLPGNCYLSGYWQSEKYFSIIEDVVRNHFTFKNIDCVKIGYYKKFMLYENSVSVHVRRGDYVNSNFHGLCSVDYYRQAIDFIGNSISNPVLYFFSDDIGWVKNNFTYDFNVKYIDFNKGSDSWKDMYLMTLCKHHIIANSSFSWWGAWLGNNKNKIVIAPARWFLKSNVNAQDICPSSWLRL